MGAHLSNNSVAIMVQTSSNNNLLPKSQSSFLQLKWWQTKSIRTKATIIAAIVGILPTTALGVSGYSIASKSLSEQISITRQTVALDLQNEINLFLDERFKDIQLIADLEILSNSSLGINRGNQKNALERTLAVKKVYNSIGFFDLQGNVIVQTGTKPLGNHSDRGYFQQALAQNRAIISQPKISTSSGIYSIYVAAPVKDQATNQTLGVVRARIPLSTLAGLLEEFTVSGDDYYLIDETGTVFLSSAGDYVVSTQSNDQAATEYQAVKVNEVFSKIEPLLASKSAITSDNTFNQETNSSQFVAFAPAKLDSNDLNWQVITSVERTEVLTPLRNLGQIYFGGTLAVSLLVVAIAYYLTELATRPVIAAAETVAKIGQGDLDARVAVDGTDEIARLGNNINKMAFQINTFILDQQKIAQQTEIIKRTVLELGEVNQVQEVLEIVMANACQGLESQGVAIYDLQTATVIAEELREGAIPTVKTQIHQPETFDEYRQPYPQGVMLFLDDINQFEFSEAQLANWQGLGIERIAIAQIKQQGTPTYILIAHKTNTQPLWHQSDIDFLEQIVSQGNFALDRLAFLEQQQTAQQSAQQAKQKLQQQALALVDQLSPLSGGDLTIRAKVTQDEIGIIAESYNSTIDNLQKLVQQVKEAAKEVEQNAGSNQTVVDLVATNAVEQAQSITLTMQKIQNMTESFARVSENALTAENIVNDANETIVAGDQAMNQAVLQINALQNTVNETEQKAKTLGESSLEISQVVNSISRFAAQTHLLALKASIEAARAGEQGKGFATIADEVRSLAAQSATATTDIEDIVAKIQLETSQLVSAMAQGTQQVTIGTELVQQTQQNLRQVTLASQSISQLVNGIAESARSQFQTSNQVKENIRNAAISAQTNSQSATGVSLQIDRLLEVATKLQADIDKFKT